MAEALLAVRGLEAGYNPSLPIVRGVSLEVHEGEIVSVLGPNGAGKSTLLKAIAGLVKVTSGRVLLAERDITGLDTHRLVRARVAYVPQTENVFARLSVDDNLTLGALHNQEGFEAQRRRVRDIVDAFLALPAENRFAITVWGLRDSDSWLINFWGNPDWPLLFDREFEPKPAYTGFLQALQAG